jgi:hypothetical protein
MDLNEYAEKRDNYLEFAEYVKNRIVIAINKASIEGQYKYHLQQVVYSGLIRTPIPVTLGH